MKIRKWTLALAACALLFAPSVRAEDPPTTDIQVAQTTGENSSAPAALGDDRPATLGDIKGNRAAIDENRKELRAAIDRLADEVSENFRWTIGIIIALLAVPQLPGWITGIRRALRGEKSPPMSAVAPR